MKIREKIFRKNKGFTLIEILVAVAMFSVVIGGVVGVFTTTLKNQRRVLASQELIEQANYAMEYISRAMRMAKKDDVDGVNCLPGNKINYATTTTGQGGIRFRNYKNECQEFYIEGGQLKESRGSGNISALTASDFQSISMKVVFSESSGWGQADNLQPSVTIFFDIMGKEQARLQIQTTVTQRNLDVEY